MKLYIEILDKVDIDEEPGKIIIPSKYFEKSGVYMARLRDSPFYNLVLVNTEEEELKVLCLVTPEMESILKTNIEDTATSSTQENKSNSETPQGYVSESFIKDFTALLLNKLGNFPTP